MARSVRRAVVIAADDALAQRLGAGLACELDVYRSGSEASDPALWLIQVTDQPLPACRPIIALAPGTGLDAAVALLQASPDVAAVVGGHGLAPRQLVALAHRVITGELSGLDGAVAPGTPIATHHVGDHEAKARCLAQVAALVEQARLPAGLRAAIEQAIDELVTNALYAAPVDARGRQVFAGVSPRARRALRTDRDVVVDYAWDGARFAVAVRDGFGSLDRATVLHRLDDGLHAARPVGEVGGGAGMGLYLIAQAATAVCFHVIPGIATEALCVFELGAPAGALAQLGVIHSAPAGRTGAGAARRRLTRAGARRRVALALGAVAAIAVTAVAGIAVKHARAPLPLAPATEERPAVAAPLPPPVGAVAVHFVSRPPGARIVEVGVPPSADHAYTPADVLVSANHEHRFMLTMPGHAPLMVEPFTPVPGVAVPEQGGELAGK